MRATSRLPGRWKGGKRRPGQPPRVDAGGEPRRPLSERLARTAGWALAGGVIAAAVGLMVGSLPLAAGAFLVSFLARAVPAGIGLWECRRREAMPAGGVTAEEAAECLRGEGIGLETCERRFQELVSERRSPVGRTVH